MTQPLCFSSSYGPYIIRGSTHQQPSRHNRQIGYRPWYALWLIQSGTGTLTVKGQAPLKLKAPQAIFLPATHQYRLFIPLASECKELEFDLVAQDAEPRRWKNRWNRRDFPTDLHIAGLDPQPSPEKIWGIDLPVLVPDELYASCESAVLHAIAQWWRNPYALLHADARLGQWIGHYVESIAQPREITRPVKGLYDSKRKQSNWIKRANHVASQHLHYGLSVGRWAQLMGRSRQYFSKRYHEESNITADESLSRMKIEKAQQMLLLHDIPLQHIGRSCGYPQASSFTRFFKKRCQVTPKQWRERHL